MEVLETFLPGNEPSLGLLGFCDEVNGVGVDASNAVGGLLVVPRSKELGSEDDSRLRPGMIRPVVNCDWSRSLM